MSRLRRVVEFALSQPWAILPSKLSVIQDVLRFRAAGGRLSDDEILERIRAMDDYDEDELSPEERERRREEREHKRYVRDVWLEGPSASAGDAGPSPSRIAILNVFGVISQRANLLDDVSGGGSASTERLTKEFRSLVRDQSVKAIVLNIDSPGGGVYGVGELAAEILDARDTKMVVAQANSLAASAAYWIASAASEIAVTPGGEVGSIGVFSAHQDVSKMLEAEGVKVELISAGKYKTEGNPYMPLSDEARGAIQQSVDDYYDKFVRAVASGRDVAPADVRKGYGQGRVLPADRALSEGLVDRIATLDETLGRLQSRYRMKGAAAAMAEAVTIPASEVAASLETVSRSIVKSLDEVPTAAADAAAALEVLRVPAGIAELDREAAWLDVAECE